MYVSRWDCNRQNRSRRGEIWLGLTSSSLAVPRTSPASGTAAGSWAGAPSPRSWPMSPNSSWNSWQWHLNLLSSHDDISLPTCSLARNSAAGSTSEAGGISNSSSKALMIVLNEFYLQPNCLLLTPSDLTHSGLLPVAAADCLVQSSSDITCVQ